MQKQVAKNLKLFQLKPNNKKVKIHSSALTTGRYLLGRAESCDIIIPYSEISAVHAILEVTARDVRLYDMNSKNGTYVNNEKIVVEYINVGDTIKFGSLEFTFTVYKKSAELPPVLPALEPEEGKASILRQTPIPEVTIAPPETPKKTAALPKETPAVAETDIPYIVYPLAADPNSDYSEYIFEDTRDLYPIFKYDVSKQAVEVIILNQDRVYSVDYLPEKDGVYQIAGLTDKAREIEFPYLAKTEKVPFIELNKGNCIVKQLHNYKMLHLQDNKVQGTEEGIVNIQGNDIVKLTNEDLEIYVRRVSSPPKVKTPPFFRRDKELRKYLILAVLFVILPLVALNMYKVDEELKDEKDPERIATILYRQKLVVNKHKTIESSKKAPVKKQTAPKKPVVKKSTPKKVEASAQKSNIKTTKVAKTPGAKKAPKVQKVKRVKSPIPKRTPTPKKAKAKATPTPGSRASTTRTRRAAVPSKSIGKVDVYKSFDFKSSVSKLMAKGGGLRGARTAQTTSGAVSSASISGGVATSLKKAAVGTEIGSLTGTTTGKIGQSKGTEGLSAKTGVYTAGIPSETVVLGSMDPDVIRRILRDNIPFFRACYQKELDKTNAKNVAGTIRLLFTIGSSGHVSRAGVDGQTRLPAKVKGCVVGVLRGIKFPAPMGGGTVDVKQPFNFYPKRL